MEGLPIVIFYILNILVSLVYMIVFYSMTASREQKLLLLIATSNFIMNNGIGIMFWGYPEGAPLIGMALFYLGGAFISLFFMFAFAAMMHFKIGLKTAFLLVSIGLIFAGLAAFEPETHLYYETMTIERRGLANIVTYDHNWLFALYLIWHLSNFAVMFVITIRCRIKRPLLFFYLRKGLIKSALCGVFSMTLFILSAYLSLGMDFTGFGCNLGLLFLIRTIYNNNLYPVRQDTQKAILDNTQDIIVSLDSEGGFEYANQSARHVMGLLNDFPYGKTLKGADETIDSL
ncbi:MAG: hypothetical protein ILP10_06310, partial [Lachnospiraceae bacterium]|nr:hypothetical protein [Lachnospiraceae bacterium]